MAKRKAMSGLDLTIITGMSGAGRSTAADALEDLGFFVIDNLPSGLIPKVAELAGSDPDRYAFVVDARSGSFIDDLNVALSDVRRRGARAHILFLDATDETLIRRFEESRRVHPLAAGGRVSEGIANERRVLQEVKGQADVIVDTTNLNVHELRDRLHELMGKEPQSGALQTTLVSFGFKHGVPVDVDFVFDCRFLPNPHWVEELRPLDGADPAVRAYVLDQPEAQAFLAELERLFTLLLPSFVREGKAYLTIGIGCTGGRHRSVAVADELVAMLRRLEVQANVYHRDLERE